MLPQGLPIHTLLAPMLLGGASGPAVSERPLLPPEEQPAAESSDGWEFEVRPYLWAASVSGEASVGNLPPEDFEKDLDDIVSDLDLAFMLSFEARPPGGDFGIVLDSMYMDLAGTTNSADWELEQVMLELDLAVRVAPNFDLLAGVRYFDIENSVDIPMPPNSASGDESWFDPLFGARGALPLGERWALAGRGDIGGFGVGSELTWQLAGYVFFEAASWMDVGLGYRHLDIDYEDGPAEIDLGFSGPVLAFDFRF